MAAKRLQSLSAAEQARIDRILGTLAELYPKASCELEFRGDPFQLLCATILSAQCTDVRVNMVTPALFARWPDARALAGARQKDVEKIIQSTGFFRNKAKNLTGTARRLVDMHGGNVPRTMVEMIELPGVARKTANVVLGTAFGLTTGVVVDTHVMRLSARLALSRHADAKKIELDLMAKIPQPLWILFAHQLIWHGRRVCYARKPKCDACRLAPVCPSSELPGRAIKRGVRSRSPLRSRSPRRRSPR